MTLRILVADDDADIADVLRMTLTTMGNDVVMSATARDSIAQLGSGQFDGVLLDLTMPDMPPDKLVASILDIAARPPIVVFSARSARETRSYAERLGAAVLTKPCEVSELLDAIETTFNGRPSRGAPKPPLEAR